MKNNENFKSEVSESETLTDQQSQSSTLIDISCFKKEQKRWSDSRINDLNELSVSFADTGKTKIVDFEEESFQNHKKEWRKTWPQNQTLKKKWSDKRLEDLEEFLDKNSEVSSNYLEIDEKKNNFKYNIEVEKDDFHFIESWIEKVNLQSTTNDLFNKTYSNEKDKIIIEFKKEERRKGKDIFSEEISKKLRNQIERSEKINKVRDWRSLSNNDWNGLSDELINFLLEEIDREKKQIEERKVNRKKREKLEEIENKKEGLQKQTIYSIWTMNKKQKEEKEKFRRESFQEERESIYNLINKKLREVILEIKKNKKNFFEIKEDFDILDSSDYLDLPDINHINYIKSKINKLEIKSYCDSSSFYWLDNQLIRSELQIIKEEE